EQAISTETTTVPLAVTIHAEDPAKRLERRLSQFSDRLKDRPDDVELLLSRGAILRDLDRTTEALQVLTRAVELAPDSADCRYHRGIVYAAAGEHDRAIADMEAALARLPAQSAMEAILSNHLAWLYVTGPARFWNPQRALKLVHRALRRQPGVPGYWNTLGVAHYRDGNWDEAIEALEHSLHESQEPASDLYFLALCYLRLQEPQRALQYYQQAVYWHENHAAKLDRGTRDELDQARSEFEAAFVPAGSRRPSAADAEGAAR
ncbi:MAG TPA: tetratricopeptide repeat protein, partial [Gemmataceae bacterium]|nr:tetratricopeptide repeat protein [Gemmataceae bacterium]